MHLAAVLELHLRSVPQIVVGFAAVELILCVQVLPGVIGVQGKGFLGPAVVAKLEGRGVARPAS